MKRIRAACVLLLSACVWRGAPGAELNCCEGDILLLLDSSGSVSNYEFSRMIRFLSELLLPFLLGRGQVRVALVQVHTEPQVEFDFDAYGSQNAFQEALLRTRQLRGNTNTEAALLVAQRLLWRPPRREAPPRVLLWVTDGVEPGNIEEPMAALKEDGVNVLAVSTGQSHYQLLSRAVTPPIYQHLYFVNVDDISIVTNDLRDAIIELLRADRLHVREVTSNSALLQWRPVLIGGRGHHELRYSESEWNRGEERTLRLPSERSWTELTDLRPNTPYRARLTTHTLLEPAGRTLSASFRTLPSDQSDGATTDALRPETVTVSESRPDRLLLSWTPVGSGHVQLYRVECGPIPRGGVRSITVPASESSALLTQLRPDTHYLITITAVHASGQEGAISVRACTQEAFPALIDLRLTPVGLDSVKVDWRIDAGGAGLQGYWVKWEMGGYSSSSSSSSSSSRYLPAQSLSTVLTHLSAESRVCVSPVYRTAQGEGLCCTHTHTHTHTQLHTRGRLIRDEVE